MLLQVEASDECSLKKKGFFEAIKDASISKNQTKIMCITVVLKEVGWLACKTAKFEHYNYNCKETNCTVECLV